MVQKVKQVLPASEDSSGWNVLCGSPNVSHNGVICWHLAIPVAMDLGCEFITLGVPTVLQILSNIYEAIFFVGRK